MMFHLFRASSLLLPLLAAGCNPPFRSFPPMTDEGCRRVAENDPVTRRELARYAGGTQRDKTSLDEATADAYARCLRTSAGGQHRGGVELLRRGY